MLNLPPIYTTLLRQSEYEGAVYDFVACLEPILESNKTPFFPYFTDHGSRHLEAVIETQVKLIPEAVIDSNLLSAADAAVAICSACLHDIGMHLAEDGFLALISGKCPHRPLPWFNDRHGSLPPDRHWLELWSSFTTEIKRFSDSEIVNLMGDCDRTGVLFGCRRDSTLPHPNKWTTQDYMLIGEFLRRHHARLAHEIAMYGFPSTTENTERSRFRVLLEDVPKLADIIGVVARSHGVSLRFAADYIAYLFPNNLRPRDCLPIYHMALLRIADYLQLDSVRAPAVLLQLRQPPSPISLREWKSHQAVLHVSYDNVDTHALYIDVNCMHSLRTHLHLKEIVNGLQLEMDLSSAVLSEVYGRATHLGLDKLLLQKTRVRTNLEQQSLLSQLPYLPVRASFSSSPHILALLVRPLYGESAAVGVRELLQNAVDSIRERDAYCLNHSENPTSIDTYDQDSDVVISLSASPPYKLTVLDRGIGMTAETVVNYFLKAGASFRSNPKWREAFTDADGCSQVARTGKFGIGVFAAFLLGERIHVQTRHLSQRREDGLVFSAGREDEVVEIRKASIPIGTKIEVELHQVVANLLLSDRERWDWFVLQRPTVTRLIRNSDGSTEKLPQATVLPDEHAPILLDHWRRVTCDPYSDVHWTYGLAPQLTCNGIVVSRTQDDKGRSNDEIARSKNIWWSEEFDCVYKYPNLSIFDREAALPLTLRRDGLTGQKVAFERALFDDLSLFFIAFALICSPTAPENDLPVYSGEYLRRFPYFQDNDDLIDSVDEVDVELTRVAWVYNNEGVIPSLPGLIGLFGNSRLLVYGSVDSPRSALRLDGPFKSDLFLAPLDFQGIEAWGELFDWACTFNEANFGRPLGTNMRFVTGEMPKWDRTELAENSKFLDSTGPEFISTHRRKCLGQFRSGEEFDCSTDIQALLIKSLRRFTNLSQGEYYILEAKFANDGDESRKRKYRITEKWLEIIGRHVVPFESSKRNELIDKCRSHTRMLRHIIFWENMMVMKINWDYPFDILPWKYKTDDQIQRDRMRKNRIKR
jgi:hypothetical protein